MEERTQAKKRSPWLRLALAAAVLILCVALARAFGLGDYLTLDNVPALARTVQSWGWLGPVLYILLWIVACLFFLPGSPLTILGSLVFGVWWALPLVTIGANLGAQAAFLAGRYAARPLVENWAKKSPKFNQLEEGVRRHGWRMVLITRLVPLFPFNFQNWAYGLTPIPFRTYALVTLAGMLPGTAAFAFAGGSLVSGGGDIKRTLLYLSIGAVLFVAVSFIPGWVKKKYGVLEEENRPQRPS